MKPLKAPPRPKPLLDATGIKVPPEILALWNRRVEIQELLHNVAVIKHTASRDNDKLIDALDRDAIASLTNQLKSELQAAIPYAVCPTCNGVKSTMSCICKGRGYLSKFVWDTCVPIETKKITGRNK
jgi:hypothetical protein